MKNDTAFAQLKEMKSRELTKEQIKQAHNEARAEAQKEQGYTR